jgi:hypothetical protein
MVRVIKSLLAVVFALVAAVPAFAQKETTRTFPPLTQLGSSAMLDVGGYGTASIEVSQIGSMTLTFYISNTGNLLSAQTVSLTPPNSTTSATATTTIGVWKGDIASFKYLHVVVTAYTSGTASVTLGAIGLSQSVASGGGGTINGAVKILDTAGVNQMAVNASGQASIICANCTGTGVSQVDTTAFTPTTSLFAPFGGEVDDASTATLSEGQAGAVRVTSQRGLHTNLRNDGGTELATASNPLRTDPTGTTAQPVTDNGSSLTIDAPVGTPVSVRISNGVGNIDTLPVSLASVPSHAVTNAGTFVVQENGAGLTALQLIDNLPNTIGSATSGQSGVLTLCATTTAAPTNTNAQSNPFSCDTSGAIRVTGSSGTTQFNEDSASSDAQALVGLGFVRRDTVPAMNAGAVGDWAWPSIDGNGRIYTQSVIYNSAGAELAIATDYTEDNASAGGESGPLVISKRVDTPGSGGQTGTDGDYQTFTTDAFASLWVNCRAGCSGGTQYTHDAALTIGTSVGTAAVGRASAAVPTDVTADNDAVIAWYLRSGAQVTQTSFAGVLATAGNGVSGTGVQRVTIASDSTGQVALAAGAAAIGTVNPTTAANWGVYVEDGAESAGGNLSMAGSVRRDVAASSASTTGDNATLNTDSLGLLYTRKLDPCSGVAKTHIPINISTATTTELTAALAGASNHYYICALDLIAAGADNVALVDDDTDGCASVTSGLAGGTTAASGWNLAANGGLVKGNGDSTVFKTGGTNRVVCLVTSAAVQLSGSIQVVAAP